MKKYIGLIKIVNGFTSGTNIKILSKSYDDINLFNIWFNMYPNAQHILLENTEELNSMFEAFRDITPISHEEKTNQDKVKIKLRKIIK